jgi:hypothetical protein
MAPLRPLKCVLKIDPAELAAGSNHYLGDSGGGCDAAHDRLGR